MRCIKCTEDNICKANYCKNCGYQFSKEEQKVAKEKTLVGKIEKLDKLKKIKSIITLKIITENTYFKIIVLLFILATGVFFQIQYGNQLRILESKHYQIQYNTQEKEYYLLIDQEKTILNLYKPNYIKELSIVHCDQEGNSLETFHYEKDKTLELQANTENDYYLLKAKREQKKEEIMKIYIFRKDSENE